MAVPVELGSHLAHGLDLGLPHFRVVVQDIIRQIQVILPVEVGLVELARLVGLLANNTVELLVRAVLHVQGEHLAENYLPLVEPAVGNLLLLLDLPFVGRVLSGRAAGILSGPRLDVALNLHGSLRGRWHSHVAILTGTALADHGTGSNPARLTAHRMRNWRTSG